jgi:acetyltransferase-like isoleucine patch superfamily enzyme|tara:strand:- start:6851 stop:7462 length:612 start_codon:yes stop_codon:yes gene_type:complete
MLINFLCRLTKSLQRKRLFSKLHSFGDKFSCDPSTKILLPRFFSAGNNVFIGEQSYISAKVDIADNVMFGPRVIILGGNHHFAVKGRFTRDLKQDPSKEVIPILIECDVWIGACSTIIGPVTIGSGSVIGANSVVTKSIAPYTVNVGSPSSAIRLIFNDADLFEHLCALGNDKLLAKKIVYSRNFMVGDKSLPVVNRSDDYWE